MILSKPRPKVEQILTALRDRFACRSRFVPFDGVEDLVTTTGHIRSRSRSGRSTSGRAGGDRCGMSVARATSTRSLTGSGPPRSVGTRVVVGFQCLITHGAVGERFVPAEKIRVRDSGDGRADERRQPEHPQLGGCAVGVEERHPRRARRVDRRVGDRDRDQVDQGECKADRQTGEPLGARSSVDPRMTSRKTPVRTISARITGHSE